MDIQRVRNLTTGIIHTEMQHIYEDIRYITGIEHIFTHMLPKFHSAMLPYLKNNIKDPIFWNDKYDTSHIGEIELKTMNTIEKQEFLNKIGK